MVTQVSAAARVADAILVTTGTAILAVQLHASLSHEPFLTALLTSQATLSGGELILIFLTDQKLNFDTVMMFKLVVTQQFHLILL